jgi:hypothetical protein
MQSIPLRNNSSHREGVEMTHDELLALIDEEHWHLFNFHSEDQSEKAIEFRGAVLKITRERRSVVELHKPIEGHENLCSGCWFGDGMMSYPCPTIQAIEKELG